MDSFIQDWEQEMTDPWIENQNKPKPKQSGYFSRFGNYVGNSRPYNYFFGKKKTVTKKIKQ